MWMPILLTCLLLVEQLGTADARMEKNWAVLVAGSNMFSNYRHQADVCHAYHVLRDRGIPPENIITFMYDDIANNEENPFPGQIFNDYQHVDVYNGVQIDYKENDVTPEMFLRVLKGDLELKKQGRKVLESGPKDNVFIFFSDHGAPGLVAFPNTELYAHDLNDTLTFMYENHRYNEMVIYIEACESGSMFENILSPNIRIFATSAANSVESSYASFCDDPELYTCLADDYSYRWMIDTESHNIHHRSLEDQYERVRFTTKNSHVMQFGDMKISGLNLDEFEGHSQPSSKLNNKTIYIGDFHSKPSTHAHIITLTRQMLNAKTDVEHERVKRKLDRVLQLGHLVKHTFEDIVMESKHLDRRHLVKRTKREELECLKSVFQHFRTHCFTIQQVPEVAQHVHHLVKLCNDGFAVRDIIRVINRVC